MPYLQDEMEDNSQAKSEKAYIQQRALGVSGRRRNGADNPVGRTIFAEQIDAMTTMAQKLYHQASRVSEAADTVHGPRPEKSPGDGQTRGASHTVAQAWTDLCEAADELERQVGRFYV